MKFLAIENFPLASVNLLRTVGLDVKAIGVDYSRVTDIEVVDIATAEMRIILTFDRDYGELIFRQNMRPPARVVYLRIRSYGPEDPGRLVHELTQREDISLEGALTVLDYKLLRQGKYV